MSIYDLVRQAIQTKKVIKATYDGMVRWMCPHVIGTKNGREHALFYQFAGKSKKGLGPPGSRHNWRCLFLDELSNVSVEDGIWHTAPNHSRPQSCVDEIDVEVSH
jgi:hypothetical protein